MNWERNPHTLSQYSRYPCCEQAASPCHPSPALTQTGPLWRGESAVCSWHPCPVYRWSAVCSCWSPPELCTQYRKPERGNPPGGGHRVITLHCRACSNIRSMNCGKVYRDADSIKKPDYRTGVYITLPTFPRPPLGCHQSQHRGGGARKAGISLPGAGSLQ